MSQPERLNPLGEMPASLRDRLPQITAADITEDPYHYGESPKDVQERADRAQASKARMWAVRRPARFADASLDQLTESQNPERMRAWLDSTALNLVLRSEEPGVGKTHVAYAVGNVAVENGAWAQGWTVVAFNDAIRPGGDDTANMVAQECDLLLLDDLGKEKISDWTLERLQEVLDARWSNRRRTIFTTNLDGDALVDRYGEAIVDRIRDEMWYQLIPREVTPEARAVVSVPGEFPRITVEGQMSASGYLPDYLELVTEPIPRAVLDMVEEHGRITRHLGLRCRAEVEARGWSLSDCELAVAVDQEGTLFDRNEYRVVATLTHRPPPEEP